MFPLYTEQHTIQLLSQAHLAPAVTLSLQSLGLLIWKLVCWSFLAVLLTLSLGKHGSPQPWKYPLFFAVKSVFHSDLALTLLSVLP